MIKKFTNKILEGILLLSALASPAIAGDIKLKANKLELPVEHQYNIDLSGEYNNNELEKIQNVFDKISHKVPNLADYQISLSNDYDKRLKEQITDGLEDMLKDEECIKNIKETEKIWAEMNNEEYDENKVIDDYVKKTLESIKMIVQEKNRAGFSNDDYSVIRREDKMPRIEHHAPWGYEWVIAHELGHKITCTAAGLDKTEKAKKLFDEFLNLYMEGNSVYGGKDRKVMEDKITRLKGYVSSYPLSEPMFWDKVSEDIAETFTYYVLGHKYADDDPIVIKKVDAIKRYLVK